MVYFLTASVCAWVLLFWDFLNGNIVFNLDTTNNYAFFKFFYNNLFNGVVPLWDPFKYVGQHYLGSGMHGILTPAAILASLTHFLGLNYYQMYTVFIVGNFLLGLWGFYCLALETYGSKFYAGLAFVLLLFSGLGAMLFNQINVLLIFIPSVWFFYFLVCFLKYFKLSAVVGMLLALLAMSVSYFPFHFLTVLGLSGILGACVWAGHLKGIGRTTLGFIKTNAPALALCACIFALGLLPAVMNFIVGSNHENFFLARHAASLKVITNDMEPDPQMSFEEVGFEGTLGPRILGGRLLAHLDKFNYLSDDFFYVPVLAYILIALGIFTTFCRRRFFLLFLGLGIFLIALGAPGHVLQLLYTYIPIFKLFRNHFFFMAFLIPLIILFAVAQAQALFKQQQAPTTQRWPLALGIAAIHALFAAWIYSQGDVLISSYASVIFSLAIFMGILFRSWGTNPRALFMTFLLLCVLEPVEVYTYYKMNAAEFTYKLAADHARPTFNYTRPLEREDKACKIFQYRSSDAFWYDMAMKDSTGFMISFPDFVSKQPYIFYLIMGQKDYEAYVHHKILLYDQVKPLGESPLETEEFIASLKDRRNMAFISTKGLSKEDLLPPKDASNAPLVTAEALEGDSPQVKAVDYNVNSLRLATNFTTSKFLVFNDAYSRYWNVFINGKGHKILRANMGFKGVWVPAGAYEVLFKYTPPLGAWSIILFMALMLGLTSWVIFLSLGERKTTPWLS